MRPGIEDVVFAYLRFPSGITAHLHLSWLDPHKERRFTVVGSRRMATFDDMELERKLTIYDKGFDEKADSWGEYITRSGDIDEPADRQRRAAAPRVRAFRAVHCAPARRRDLTGTAVCASSACSRACRPRSTGHVDEPARRSTRAGPARRHRRDDRR
jgi:predicted dehydrogenase